MNRASIAFSLAALAIASVPARAAIPWEKSLDDAKKRAVKEKKVIVIDFWANWCGWCKVQDREVFDKPKMAEFAKGQVYLKLNTEDGGEGSKLARELSVTSLPTTVVLDAKGVEIDRVLGYVALDPYIERIKAIVEGKSDIVVLSKKVEGTSATSEDAMRLASMYLERNNLDKARESLERVLAKDPANAGKMTDDALLILARIALYSGKTEDAKKHLKSYLEKYPNEQGAADAKNMLGAIEKSGKSGASADPGAIEVPEAPRPTKKARYDEVPGLDLALLTAASRTSFLDRVNKDICSCGCEGDTIAQCIHVDPACTTAPRLARALYDEAIGKKQASR